MQYSIKPLDHDQIGAVTKLANEIYNGLDEDKYPDFRVGYDINAEENREKYFTMFMLPSHFVGFNQRRAYGVFDDNDRLISAVGVRRYDHFPCWSLSWLLSPKIGARFIPLFRFIVDELCKIHETAGFNELLVTYPSSREEAYSRIMLFMRERYFTFVETTIPAKTVSAFGFIHELSGKTLHPHDINLRRYILRREDMTPASEGGQAKRKIKQDND
jgi:hypothetical protein